MHDETLLEDAVETESEAPAEDDDGLLESLLVEEVSIDGMCGVY